MADGERLVADPAEVAGTRSEFDITPFVNKQGPDWGDMAIISYLAEQQTGSVTVDFRIPNRQIAVPLLLTERNGYIYDEAVAAVQALVALWQAEGGWIKREITRGAETRKLYADVDSATLKLGGSSAAAYGWVDADGVLTIDCLPDWYGDEEKLELHVGANGQVVFVETGIAGSFPRGNRCRIVVTGDPDNDQLGLKYGIRSRHYSSAATAALSYEAEALDPLDLATVVTLSGASGGGSNNAVRHNNLGTSWTPVLGLQLAAGGYLTHTDTYRVEVRAYTTSATPPELRCVYDVGDLVNPAENDKDAKAIPGASNFYLLDLGEIRLDPSPVGDHRWLGQIQARGAVGGENVYIDRVRFWPVGESYARIAVSPRVVEGLANYVARDEFKQTSGNLTGKSAAVGGAYSSLSDSDATDFTINTATGTARRTATSDTGTLATVPVGGSLDMVGRAVGLNINLGDTAAAIEYAATATVPSFAVGSGLLLRVVDTNNFLAVVHRYALGGYDGGRVEIVKVVSGASTLLASATLHAPANGQGEVRAQVTGRTVVAEVNGHVLTASDADLEGTLASGDVHIYDEQTWATAVTRDYENFRVWEPDPDAAIFAGGDAQIATAQTSRTSRDGLGSGLLVPWGDNPRLPSGGPVEIMVATSRGDFDQVPDSGLDDVSVAVRHRPCWLTTPAAT